MWHAATPTHVVVNQTVCWLVTAWSTLGWYTAALAVQCPVVVWSHSPDDLEVADVLGLVVDANGCVEELLRPLAPADGGHVSPQVQGALTGGVTAACHGCPEVHNKQGQRQQQQEGASGRCHDLGAEGPPVA